MRILEGFHLRHIAGDTVAVPTGAVAAKLSGLAILNDTAEFLFERLQTEQTEESLVAAMLEQYEIDTPTALADVREFLDTLRQCQLLVE